ncbi:putative thioredoxin [Brevibacillus phage SecTim467]|uniref:Putative thioredoxin n=2 Tax=Jenstvirus jenst TaxID=1982225 RepID=A0A0K2CNS1_9CAUD|nr:putative thioredoxin [Brevibacillus phage Jenst]ALA07200.1 putative thioredoxin [Brevibacillus phage Jenst]ALA07421.1 putative thioredoxin [Brevibacillus phage SecTim467]
MQVLNFLDTRCSPCKQLTLKLEKIAEARGLTIEEIDIEQNPSLAEKHSVMSVPTVVLVKAEVEVGRFVGDQPEAVIAAHVDQALNT